MGFSFRKSFKAGPIRLNLSRSGLGVSTGVKGFRVGVGPRGSYASASAGGFTYRKNLSAGSSAPTKPSRPLIASDGMQDIDSADVTQMYDESSSELLTALNKVQKRIQLFPIALILAILLIPSLFPLLLFIPLAIYARHLDITKGTVVLNFDLDAKAKKAFEEMVSAFQEVLESKCIWHIHAQGKNADLKKNAGAEMSVKRQIVKPTMGIPKRVSSSLEVPFFPAGKQKLYFFPDRVLIFEKRKVGSVSYQVLLAEVSNTRFIESGKVPDDAEVVGTTWQYVNKSGGPDRRFANNRELYIAKYGELALKSDTGLNELFQTSTQEPIAAFAKSLEGMKGLGLGESAIEAAGIL